MVWCPLDLRSSNRPRMGGSAAPGHPSGQQDLALCPPRLPHLRSELCGCRSQRQRRPTSAPRSPRRCGVSLVTSANVPQIGAWECQVSGRSGPDSACFCRVTVVTVMRFPGLRRDGEPSTPERALLLLAPSFCHKVTLLGQQGSCCSLGMFLVIIWWVFLFCFSHSIPDKSLYRHRFCLGTPVGVVACPLHAHRPHGSPSRLGFPFPKTHVTGSLVIVSSAGSRGAR